MKASAIEGNSRLPNELVKMDRRRGIVREQELLRTAKYIKLWRDTISYVLKGHVIKACNYFVLRLFRTRAIRAPHNFISYVREVYPLTTHLNPCSAIHLHLLVR